MRNKVIRFLCIVLASALVDGQIGTRSKPTERVKTVEKHAPKLVPLTLNDVIDLVDKIRRDVFTEAQVVRIIQEHGVDFLSADPEILKLREKGASTAILHAVMAIAPKPPPKIEGKLLVECSPAECDVAINDRMVGSTNSGRLLIEDLDLKEYTVGFTKPGYLSEQRTAIVQANTGTPLLVALEPNYTTQAENGRLLWGSVLSALGVGSDTSQLRSLTAIGTISFRAERESTWRLTMALQDPGLVSLKAESKASGTFLLQCRNENCVAKKKVRRSANPSMWNQVEAGLRDLSRYTLSAVLNRLRAEDSVLSSKTAEGPGIEEQSLGVRTKDGLYLLTMNRELLPSELIYRTSDRSEPQVKVTFQDYVHVGTAQYPKRTHINLKGPSPQDVEIRFDAISAGSPIRNRSLPKYPYSSVGFGNSIYIRPNRGQSARWLLEGVFFTRQPEFLVMPGPSQPCRNRQAASPSFRSASFF